MKFAAGASQDKCFLSRLLMARMDLWCLPVLSEIPMFTSPPDKKTPDAFGFNGTLGKLLNSARTKSDIGFKEISTYVIIFFLSVFSFIYLYTFLSVYYM